ncbi:glycine cleavage system protein H [Lactobacillus alvi]|uniref:Glycine cleavage system protein H n=1 Tax=Limosilactobacillus alvi TaxID=990412 RepID=A0ABS2ERC4_9LACO|nr:glycine cleavage system protein H [Limosilactobacillus alvi]MBM6754781.1 glycine cleavage system protein H [Limosilactobacillus alvi]
MQQLENPWWVKQVGQTITLGLTRQSIQKMGDLYFVDLPNPGAILSKGMPFATIESQNWVITLNSPVNGKVVATNEAFTGIINPPQVTVSWLVRLSTLGK